MLDGRTGFAVRGRDGLDRLRAAVAPWRHGARWELLLGLLVLSLLGYSWMYADITVPNERTRAYLVVSLVDHGTLSIDKAVERYGPVNDWARRGGHYYTDKAPGTSLLGVVPYWIARRFTKAEDWKIAEVINLMRTWVMLPVALVGFFWMRRLLRRLGQAPAVVDLASLAWTLGTTAFHYGTAFYGHQIVAVCLVGALDLVLRAEEAVETALRSPPPAEAAVATLPDAGGGSPRGPWRTFRFPLFGAGLLAGLAGLTEYQAGIPAALLALYVVSGPLRRRPTATAMLVLGALPFVVLLFGYNTLAFGGPFRLSYQFLVDPGLRELHAQGIGGVGAPHASYLWGGLFSLHRGFFTTSPILLLSIPGLVVLARQGRPRLAVLFGAALLYFFAFLAGTKIWHGNWSFGCRLLVPVMGWAMVPAAFCAAALRRWRTADALARGLALAGFAYHQAVHAVFPELPDNATNPVIDAVLPALRGPHVSPNLATRLLGWHGRLSLLPLLLLAALAAAAMLRGAGERRSWDERAGFVVAAFGTALVLALIILIHKPGWNPGDVRWFTDWLAHLAQVEDAVR